MIIALTIALIVIASVVFTFVSPWTFTPLASNWWAVDLSTNLTFAVTGLAFVVVNLFLAYVIVRYRHRRQSQAEYMPEKPRLEKTLIAITTVGIVVLLAPGMFVYNELISAPADAMKVEVLGEQWRWTYRFAGEDGELGATSPELFGPQNPYGIDPDDPAGDDDVLIQRNTLHLPVDVPVRLQIRSKDVIHNFYVPNFRVKMDAVPGMITNTWFTPTRTGSYDLVCAEYCGRAHYTMVGEIVVEKRDAFQEWLAGQPTLAGRPAGDTGDGEPADGDDTAEDEPQTPIERGQMIAQSNGCLGCHSIDGTSMTGPTWQGLFGNEVALKSGETVTADEDYIINAIRNPNDEIHEGYPANLMQAYGPSQISDDELEDLVEYIKSLSEGDSSPDASNE